MRRKILTVTLLGNLLYGRQALMNLEVFSEPNNSLEIRDVLPGVLAV